MKKSMQRLPLLLIQELFARRQGISVTSLIRARFHPANAGTTISAKRQKTSTIGVAVLTVTALFSSAALSDSNTQTKWQVGDSASTASEATQEPAIQEPDQGRRQGRIEGADVSLQDNETSESLQSEQVSDDTAEAAQPDAPNDFDNSDASVEQNQVANAEPQQALPEEAENSQEDTQIASATEDGNIAAQDGTAPPPIDLTGKSVTDNRVNLLPSINTLPKVDTDPALSANIDRQFQQILALEETEDAFSPRLEEAYLGYGQTLAQAGRLDDARDMFARALHLARVNHGLYSLEQRPVLRALFEMHFARGEIEDSEQALKQVVWLEKKNPDDRDRYSFDMVVRLGNMYISEYLASPKITEENLTRVNRGIRYLSYAIDRYGDTPLDTMLMPYGEIALLYVIKSRISRELDSKFYENQRHRSFADYDRSPTSPSRRAFLSNAVEQLEAYHNKAVKEGRLDHRVRALRDLGDLHMLFLSPQNAAEFYRKAWSLATELGADHELVRSFEEPSYIPDFNYAGARDDIDYGDRFVKVPLSFSLNRLGRVNQIYTGNEEGPYPTLVKRAKRASKKLQFRPPIDNGDMISTETFNFDVSVALRSSEELPDSGNSDSGVSDGE